jgi:hypothetical protein
MVASRASATIESLSHHREPQPPSRASATIESLSHHREPQPPSRAFRQAQCGTSGNGFSSNYENGITNRLNGG